MPPKDIFEYLEKQFNLDNNVYDRLRIYHDLLLKWQSKINLVSNDSLRDVWTRHFIDSLQLLPLLPKKSSTIVDMGSGAGFPGMVIALATSHKIHLIESDGKKIAFLREVSRATSTNVKMHHCRVSDVDIPDVDIVVARALANLDSLLQLSSTYVSHETICLFPKGKNYATELDDAKRHWCFTCNVIPSITDTDSVILQLSHMERRQT